MKKQVSSSTCLGISDRPISCSEEDCFEIDSLTVNKIHSFMQNGLVAQVFLLASYIPSILMVYYLFL